MVADSRDFQQVRPENADMWNGRLYVFKDDSGQEYVTASVAALFDKLNVRVFQASGPFMPVAYPQAALVGDPERWMTELQEKGFKFEPATVE
jgi:hypothetical protein